MSPGRHLDEKRCKNSFWSMGLSALVPSSQMLSISSSVLPDEGQKALLHDDL